MDWLFENIAELWWTNNQCTRIDCWKNWCTTQIAEKLEKCFFPKRFFHLKPNIYLFDTQLFFRATLLTSEIVEITTKNQILLFECFYIEKVLKLVKMLSFDIVCNERRGIEIDDCLFSFSVYIFSNYDHVCKYCMELSYIL